MNGLDHFVFHDGCGARRTLLIRGQAQERSVGRINDDRFDVVHASAVAEAARGLRDRVGEPESVAPQRIHSWAERGDAL